MRYRGPQVQGELATERLARARPEHRAAGAALVTLAAAIILVILALPAPAGSTAGGAGLAHRDRDCADFPNQAAAQDYFIDHGGPSSDPDSLDGDSDGIACESNPCPCSSAGGGGSGGGSGGGGNHGGGGTGDGGSSGGRKHATVTEITDGDTIDVTLRGRSETIRVLGVDTPEVYFGAECGAAQASSSMHRLLAAGDRIQLIRDPSQDNRDRYDRLLRYVVRSGRDVGRRQIRKGWAEVYVFETPFERVDSYRQAEASARQANRGVWKRCNGNFHQPL